MEETTQIKQILQWIGFTSADDRNNIASDAFSTYAEAASLTVKDITSLADDYSRRTANNGRINFGIKRIKRLQNLIHWVKDNYRTSLTPTIEDLTGEKFLMALETAGKRSEVRKKMIEDSDTNAKEASPGPLKSELIWTEWQPKFVNYLSTILGVGGVPLSYVIRDNEDPDRAEFFANFNEQCIAQAPLDGVIYEADRSSVHQHLVSFTTGQPSENWIKPMLRFRDGRKSMKALCAHFEGEGNATRRIAEADRLRDNLHYKSERSMRFESFLTKSQKMYNIYSRYKEDMNDDAKIRFLFKKVQHPGLKTAVEAMKAKVSTSPQNTVTYTMVTNHLMSAVTELPEYISTARNVSDVSISEVNTNRNVSLIHNSDGSINTGHYPQWKKLSRDDRQSVISERKRLGITGYKGSSKTKGDSSDKMKKSNAKYKRTIAALKKKLKDASGGVQEQEDNQHVKSDAGDQFGGKRAKYKSDTS